MTQFLTEEEPESVKALTLEERVALLEDRVSALEGVG